MQPRKKPVRRPAIERKNVAVKDCVTFAPAIGMASVIGIARVTDEDEIFMMTAKGKIQRIKAADIGVIGRNTQGVRIMNVDEGDSLIAVVRVPAEEASDEEESDEASAGDEATASDSEVVASDEAPEVDLGDADEPDSEVED